MIGERDYQTLCRGNILGALSNGTASTLAVMPTGTGKTFTGMMTIADWFKANPGRRALWIAHREELIFQPADAWQKLTGARPLIEMGDLHADSSQSRMFGAQTDNRLIIATVQTLNSGRRCSACTGDCLCNDGEIEKPCPTCGGDGCPDCEERGSFTEKCPECHGSGYVRINDECTECYQGVRRRFLKFDPDSIGLVVMDEAHHSPASSYVRVKEYFTNAKLLGLTATPDRADEVAMGRVYESVAFEYQLPQAIDDGWLVSIAQQYIVVEDLDFSKVRTTAGDLNEGDLEAIIREETTLHRIAAPTIELAGDRPVLAFTPGVQSAEDLCEIFNRHKPGSAVCITGKTPREDRREEIKRFQNGERQYLVGCGVFLEGFDAPATSVICMARPTKSRSLYAQAIGRGTRPLAGVVDGLESADERRGAIAFSDKPDCLVLDFVGNSGRHKLISTADILGGNYSDDIIAAAVQKARKATGAFDMRKTIEEVHAEREEQKRRTAAQRRIVQASARYSTTQIDPFDVFDSAPGREPGWHKGRKPSEKMIETLKKFKIDLPPDLTFHQAHELLDTAIGRMKKGLASYGQMKILRKYGYDNALQMTFKDASATIDAIAKNGWKRPA